MTCAVGTGHQSTGIPVTLGVCRGRGSTELTSGGSGPCTGKPLRLEGENWGVKGTSKGDAFLTDKDEIITPVIIATHLTPPES